MEVKAGCAGVVLHDGSGPMNVLDAGCVGLRISFDASLFEPLVPNLVQASFLACELSMQFCLSVQLEAADGELCPYTTPTRFAQSLGLGSQLRLPRDAHACKRLYSST